ncbi:hypothetical protein GPECTOR_2g1182 [Gonium pectorale]|uniref:Serpin domain-containing protein n=1 Tax=Gonium pectorale TaxID=33097 RepID=A0A150H0X4_GONPE|nr:hypothetical protein GPECTOR_2g1182 [Gonium pectorale]|eukprot:KXZ55632.1 hypothetical protein GPECTOR_2g1182 [Gonium pectorale]
MAECSATPSPVATAIASAGYSLFLTALPLSGDDPQGCFLSPLSILYALSLALNGAGPGSSTHTELLRVVGGPSTGQQQQEAELNSELGRAMALLNQQCSTSAVDGPSSELILANSLWTAPGAQLKAAYVEQMRTLFTATASVASNGARDINSWVADVTRGMIQDLVQSDDFEVVLANAIYFKGLWEEAFKKTLTQPGDFTTASGAIKQVDMMKHEFKSAVGIRRRGTYDAVVLPYKGGAFSAVALLPVPGVTVAEALRDWAEAPQDYAPLGKLWVKLPKFKVTSQLSLKPVLKSLGVQAAFSPGADFSRMAERGLFVSDAVHKAVVEVDEEGTVAAAATRIMLTRSAMPEPPRELVFDRPFAFIIRHNPTALPAFIGAVNDPSPA